MTPSDRLAIRVPNLGLARGLLADAAVRGTTRIPQAILPLIPAPLLVLPSLGSIYVAV